MRHGARTNRRLVRAGVVVLLVGLVPVVAVSAQAAHRSSTGGSTTAGTRPPVHRPHVAPTPAPTPTPSASTPAPTTTNTAAPAVPAATATGTGAANLDGAFPLPDGAAANDVRDFGAKCDGTTDDTAAIKKTLAATYNAWEQIHFPTGTCVVSGEISWGRFITLRGDGPGRTVLKLKDGAAGYGDKNDTRAVLFCRLNGRDTTNNNTSHSNYVLDMTIDVGSGNPGAVGVDYTSHNGGMVENVVIRAGAGSGRTGLSMERDSPGPALIRNVQVEGFDYGVAVGWGLYATAMEHVTVQGQRIAGVHSDSHPLSVRGLTSVNTVPAVQVTGGRDYGLLVLVDSDLRGGSSAAAVESSGEVFLRHVATSGYESAVRDGSRTVAGPTVDEYSSSPLLTPAGGTGTSLDLPLSDPPVVPWDVDTSTWANVADFAALKSGDDWAPAIQAAIDSGRTTVYFPNYTNTNYAIGQDVVVRGAVRRIVGLSARLGNTRNGQGRLVFRTTAPVEVEQIQSDAGFVVEGTGTVHLAGSLGGGIVKQAGSGDLFVTDWCCGPVELHGGNAWARQLNIETTHSPMILNDGATLSVLGLKTEQTAQVLANKNGARTEILGGMVYPAQGDPTEPMYANDNSSLTVLHREIAGPYPAFVLENGRRVNPDFAHQTRYVSK